MKASGLAAGKGVIVAKSQGEACRAVQEIMQVGGRCTEWAQNGPSTGELLFIILCVVHIYKLASPELHQFLNNDEAF